MELAPDSPDAWYKLADNLFHYGALAGVPEALPRAVAAFARSLALDSSYAPTLQHLTEIAAFFDDTAGVIRGRALLRRIDSVSSFTIARLWHPAVWLGDTAEVRRLLASDSALGPLPTNLLVYALEGLCLSTRRRGGLIPTRVRSGGDRGGTEAHCLDLESLRTGLWAARQIASPLKGLAEASAGRVSPYWTACLPMVIPGKPPRRREAWSGNLDHDSLPRIATATLARYAVGQYNLRAGNLSPVRLAIADLRGASPTQTACGRPTSLAPLRYCSKLNSMRAKAHLKPGSACRQLDSVLANPRVPFDFSTSAEPPLFTYGNLVAARLHEEAGDHGGCAGRPSSAGHRRRHLSSLCTVSPRRGPPRRVSG